MDDIGFSQSTTLRYDPNGGTGMMADQTVGVGVNAYTATDGYTFAGHGLASWNTRSDSTGDSLQTRRHDRHRQADDFVRAMDRHHADGDAGAGGTLTNRNLTTILGGLPSGPHTNPVGKTAQAPVGQSRKAV